MRRPQYRGYDDVAEPPKAYQAAQARRSRLMPKTVGRRKMHPVEGQVPQRNSPCRSQQSQRRLALRKPPVAPKSASVSAEHLAALIRFVPQLWIHKMISLFVCSQVEV